MASEKRLEEGPLCNQAVRRSTKRVFKNKERRGSERDERPGSRCNERKRTRNFGEFPETPPQKKQTTPTKKQYDKYEHKRGSGRNGEKLIENHLHPEFAKA